MSKVNSLPAIAFMSLAFIGTFIGGCGSKENEQVSSSGTYVYSLNDDDCKTGEHQFETMNALCEGLKSQSLNKECAEDLRATLFLEYNCEGLFDLEK